MEKFEDKSFEERFNSLKEEELTERINWNKNIRVKLILLLPLITFLIVVILSKNYVNLFEVLVSLITTILLITIGVILYFKMMI
tara:strand:+ start:7050 stop:7301 length:252 start_codon:yes stop_codon:yes gene_type:complete